MVFEMSCSYAVKLISRSRLLDSADLPFLAGARTVCTKTRPQIELRPTYTPRVKQS
jgi:hypothetical protein